MSASISPIPTRSSIEHQIKSHGLQLRIVVNPGTGAEPPLLLANGIGARLELLQPVVDELSLNRTIIRFDPPNIGGSRNGLRPYRLRRLSKALGGALDELGFDEVDVLGLSWGGGVAQQFAFTQKQRCRRLVLASTGTGSIMVPAHPRILVKLLSPARYKNPTLLIEGLAQDLYGGTMRDNPEAALGSLLEQRNDAMSKGYFMQLGASAMWTSLFFLPFVRQRTLILAGNDDPIVPAANGHILHCLMRKSELRIYDGGHIGLVTEADELVPIVEEFLDAD